MNRSSRLDAFIAAIHEGESICVASPPTGEADGRAGRASRASSSGTAARAPPTTLQEFMAARQAMLADLGLNVDAAAVVEAERGRARADVSAACEAPTDFDNAMLRGVLTTSPLWASVRQQSRH